ncbi:hypothetical protein [Mesorhizobium marinum]|uniref:hypothetical protein n=1 Tax=Mesorhizobium marinum TaxID=3228790 RepID=UPI0034664723
MSLHKFDWGDRTKWPFAGPDHVFLAEAISTVGKHLSGAAWTGNELRSLYRDPPIINLPFFFEESGRYAREYAALLLKERKSAIVDPEQMTESDWTLALGAFADWRAERDRVTESIATANAFLRERCSSGEIVAAVKHEYSGNFSPIPKERWNREKALIWLRTGQIEVGEAFPSALGNSREVSHLFFEKAGLAKFAVPKKHESPGEFRYVPPYMRLMFAVIDKLGIAADNQPKSAEIRAELLALGGQNGLPEISDTLAKSTATLMREVEAKAGATWYHSQKRKDA